MNIDTSLGRLALYRSRSSVPSASSAVGGVLEDWKILLDGEELVEMRGCASPGHAMRTQVAHGVQGRVAGLSVSLAGVSSLFSTKRCVRFTSSSNRMIEFHGKWGNLLVSDESGRVIARKGASLWEIPDRDMFAFGSIALLEMAGLGYMLRNPILAVF